ncbi:MAG: GntR family transcriptional regulator [Allosphingosinicella sp.]
MAEIPIAQRIREMILAGELLPGERVAEAAIAARLGVSRTPVRNVIPVLAAEGLLEPVGRRGYVVRRFSVEDSLRATEIRCVLEGYAAREVAARGASKAVVAELRDCLAEGDRIFAKGHLVEADQEAYARMNKKFHEIIVGAAQDPLLTGLIQRVYAIPFVAPGVVAFNRIAPEHIFPILNSGQHQHHAIVDAIEGGQADLAEMLMRGHSAPARKSLGLDSLAEADTLPLAV